jgi:hypothetical protein
MKPGQDVSEYLDTFNLVKSYFLEKIEKKTGKNVLVLRRPEDETIPTPET